MTTIQSAVEFLEEICPPALAESWDNVGLLLGDRDRELTALATCLTVTPETAAEAKRLGAGLIVSHHPFPFFAAKRWTADTAAGKLLLTLAENRIAVYSPHTAHDSAFYGVNRQLADKLGAADVEPLEASELLADESMLAGLGPEIRRKLAGEIGRPLGSGRIGRLPEPLSFGELAERVRRIFTLPGLLTVGDKNRRIERIAIGCGAADTFIPAAVGAGADVLFLGETKYHKALEALEARLSLITPGHFASERFALETLAERLKVRFPDLTVFAVQNESDPFDFALS